MRNKMRKSVVSAIAGVALGCALVGGYTLGATAYSGSTETLSTNTVTFDTSYRTRITKELSAADEYLGGSIEFDLLNTNLKDSAHIDGDLGVGKFAFDSSSGSAYISSPQAYSASGAYEPSSSSKSVKKRRIVELTSMESLGVKLTYRFCILASSCLDWSMLRPAVR